jgi:ABC-2 type transport system permease protein
MNTELRRPELRRSDLRLLGIWTRAGLRALVRTPRAAFFTFIFPAVLLVFVDGTSSGTVHGAGGRVDAAQYFTPSLAVFGLSFACYTSLIFAIPRARERGILKRVRGTPVQPSVYLGSLIAVGLLSGVGSVTLLVALGAAKFGVHLYSALLPAALVTLLAGGLCLCALGLAVSSFVSNAETAPVVANITLLPLAFISGVFAPLHGAPQWLSSLASLFPLRHLVDAFSATFSPHTAGSGFAPGDLASLALWAVIGALVAVRRFRWEPVQGGGQREPHIRPARR